MCSYASAGRVGPRIDFFELVAVVIAETGKLPLPTFQAPQPHTRSNTGPQEWRGFTVDRGRRRQL